MLLPLVNRPTLDELGEVIGVEKLARLVDRFVASLGMAFEGVGRTDGDHAREAHTLISMSGMLGCEQLSQACRGIEMSAKAGADLVAPLADARALRDRTVAALRLLRAEAEAAL